MRGKPARATREKDYNIAADVEARNRQIEAGTPAGAGPLRSLDATQAVYFSCPQCEARTWVREDWVERGEKAHLEPLDEFTCRACGYELSREEKQPTSDGGVLLFGWWASCPCGQIIFTDVTIYKRDPVLPGCGEAPPSRVTCEACEETFSLALPDVTD